MWGEGETSDQIVVGRMPDGGLPSLDNRGLWAANQAGLSEIPAIVCDGGAPLTDSRLRGLESGKVIDVRGDLGTPGEVVFCKGQMPRTMAEFVMLRCSRQGRTQSGERFPLIGTLEPPRLTVDRGSRVVSAHTDDRVTGIPQRGGDAAADSLRRSFRSRTPRNGDRRREGGGMQR